MGISQSQQGNLFDGQNKTHGLLNLVVQQKVAVQNAKLAITQFPDLLQEFVTIFGQ